MPLSFGDHLPKGSGNLPSASTVSVQCCPLQNGEPLQMATTKEPALVKLGVFGIEIQNFHLYVHHWKALS